jgi:hypothetical protein
LPTPFGRRVPTSWPYRLEGALDDSVALLALTIDERAITLAALEDPPDGLAELRAVLLNEHQWRQREGLDSWGTRRARGRCPCDFSREQLWPHGGG